LLPRVKRLNSENHIGEDVGDRYSVLRVDFEDSLVRAVEDTLLDGKLNAIRDFFRKNRAEFPPQYYPLVMGYDDYAWEFVYYSGCELRRLAPRWEHCANKLKDLYGYTVENIPKGQESLLV
jgi:hypothetical protein